jgi:hypothetical protein
MSICEKQTPGRKSVKVWRWDLGVLVVAPQVPEPEIISIEDQ